MFETGNFEDKINITKCHKKYKHTFFFYDNITSTSYQCVEFHGAVTKLKDLFISTEAKYVLI